MRFVAPDPVAPPVGGEMAPRHLFPPEPASMLPGKDQVGGVRSPLMMTDLEGMALANNPTLALAARRVEALHGKYLQVGLRPNPSIGYLGEEIGGEGKAGQHGIVLGQRYVTGHKLGLNRAVVSHEIQRARQELEIQRHRVLNGVRARAYEVVAAQRMVDLNGRLFAIGTEGVKAAGDLRRAKEVSQVDVLQAQVEANSAKLALGNARNEYMAAWRRLAAVIGMPEMTPTPLADQLNQQVPTLSWNVAVTRLLAESPELARAWSGVEQAKCALTRAQAGRKPDIDVEASVRYNNASENTTATIGVGVPLQLFDRNQGNIRKAYAELAAAKWEVRRVELALQDRLAGVYKRYDNARQQTDQYNTEILPDANASLELVRKGYQQGEFGYLELLTAQRTYFRANLAYLEGLRALWTSSVEIEGLLLTGGLATPGQ
ncbi:MAG: TolC family protein [Candidatus Nealsonbacteria bacterium]|nr:TolC family protein [Candidatus Nealsonbacteria bacterium]